jgi:hypothetical protein
MKNTKTNRLIKGEAVIVNTFAKIRGTVLGYCYGNVMIKGANGENYVASRQLVTRAN